MANFKEELKKILEPYIYTEEMLKDVISTITQLVKGIVPEERYCDLLNTPNTVGGVISPGCLLGLANEVEKQRLRNDVIETDAFNSCRSEILKRLD